MWGGSLLRNLMELYKCSATRGHHSPTENPSMGGRGGGVFLLDKVSISPCAQQQGRPTAGVPKNEARKKPEADIFSRVSAAGNPALRAPGL